MIEDDTGRKFEFETPPQRIICLYGGLNEILLALGSKDKIVARTAADGHIGQIASLPAIGTHMRPNHELILNARPDIVLQMLGRQESLGDLEKLENLGIPALGFRMDSFAQLFAVTRKLGQLTGQENRAASIIADWQLRLDRLKEQYGGREPVSVFYEVRYPNLLGAGANGLVNEIIHFAGGSNVVKTPKKLARVSEETVIAANPKVYIIQQGPMNPRPQPLARRSHFKNLASVAKTLTVDEKEFSRPGPQSVGAAEKLASWLHGNSSQP